MTTPDPIVPAPATTQELVHSVGKHWLELYRETFADEVQDAQWMVGMTPVLREDTSERSKNMTSDPTFAAASDGRRIKLREAVIAAERELDNAMQVLRDVEAKLARALGDNLEPQKSSRRINS